MTVYILVYLQFSVVSSTLTAIYISTSLTMELPAVFDNLLLNFSQPHFGQQWPGMYIVVVQIKSMLNTSCWLMFVTFSALLYKC